MLHFFWQYNGTNKEAHMRVFMHRDHVGHILEKGDISVTSKMDQEGRKAASGRHTNYGYSGNILVYVWDETRWAKLTTRLVPDYYFPTQEKGNAMVRQIVAYLEELENLSFSFWWYKNRRYAKMVSGRD
jgi:hypothetical protein